jgi:hypothetical protein
MELIEVLDARQIDRYPFGNDGNISGRFLPRHAGAAHSPSELTQKDGLRAVLILLTDLESPKSDHNRPTSGDELLERSGSPAMTHISEHASALPSSSIKRHAIVNSRVV